MLCTVVKEEHYGQKIHLSNTGSDHHKDTVSKSHQKVIWEMRIGKILI